MRDLLAAASAGVVSRLERTASAARAELEASAMTGPAAVTQQQRGALRELLIHSWQAVPFHRSRLEAAGIYAGSGEPDLDRFESLAPLDRATLQARFTDLVAAGPRERGWLETSSGGSTGQPVRFLIDRTTRATGLAAKELFDGWTGYRRGQRRALLWGSERDLLTGRLTLPIRVKRYLRNELWLNAFRLTPEAMRSYLIELNRFRPVQLLGYADALAAIAAFARDHGLEVVPPAAVMSSASTLLPSQRALVEAVFGAPVFDRYGTRETGDIACQCERRDGLHVCAPLVLVEVVAADGRRVPPGEPGEVLVTTLTNRLMPLLRYRIGDLAAWSRSPCRCGRGWPTLERVIGRTAESFKLRHGGRVLPQTMIHLVGVVTRRDWVRQVQFVQEDYDRVTIRIAAGPDAPADPAADLKALTEGLRAALGGDTAIAIDLTGDFEVTASGKHRYTISRVRE